MQGREPQRFLEVIQRLATAPLRQSHAREQVAHVAFVGVERECTQVRGSGFVERSPTVSLGPESCPGETALRVGRERLGIEALRCGPKRGLPPTRDGEEREPESNGSPRRPRTTNPHREGLRHGGEETGEGQGQVAICEDGGHGDQLDHGK